MINCKILLSIFFVYDFESKEGLYKGAFDAHLVWNHISLTILLIFLNKLTRIIWFLVIIFYILVAVMFYYWLVYYKETDIPINSGQLAPDFISQVI